MRGCLIVAAVGCNFSAQHVPDARDAPDAPLGANIMFVTSATVIPGMLGSLDAADAFCQMSAQRASLPGTYVAWLSSSRVNAADRLGTARGWVRRDGLPVADRVADLVAGRMFYPPRLDESGLDVGSTLVATATDATGKRLDDTCGDFASTTGSIEVGAADGTTERWTNAGAQAACSAPSPVYCFGIDLSTTVAVSPVPGKRAFVSTTAMNLGGVDTADVQCQNDAAQLQGTFRAALATSASSAASRVGTGPWVRVDGVAFGTLDAPKAPLNVTAQGSYVATQVWTGATKPGELGDDTSTCADWAAAAATGIVGDVARSGAEWFDALTAPCAADLGVYCLEQ